jgi:hypothetical protein
MILLQESAGDLVLVKGIGVFMQEIPGVLQTHYHSEIGAYVFDEEYIYNVDTGEVDDWVEHHDMVRYLPESIKKRITVDTLFLFRIDAWDAVTGDNTSTKLYIRTRSPYMTEDVAEYLMRYYRMYNPEYYEIDDWLLGPSLRAAKEYITL